MLGAVLAMLVAMAWYRPASWESCLATVFWVMDLHEASPGFWIRGDHMRSLEAWRAPEQDVFAVSFPKSGTHWTMQIITQLLAGGGREYESVHHVCTMMDLEALSPERCQDPELLTIQNYRELQPESPGVHGTHMPASFLLPLLSLIHI
eukprot:TRINITY_DN60289_c0_g1_i1.p1 TRINITY_DN60289_c0_g1~~TRINITY_DN60289_c0_g1_i1.p1  ORF type:complete len:149 (-),score=27.58 TRINITY_DN60289_c0_g1_i1:164-610(-)